MVMARAGEISPRNVETTSRSATVTRGREGCVVVDVKRMLDFMGQCSGSLGFNVSFFSCTRRSAEGVGASGGFMSVDTGDKRETLHGTRICV